MSSAVRNRTFRRGAAASPANGRRANRRTKVFLITWPRMFGDSASIFNGLLPILLVGFLASRLVVRAGLVGVIGDIELGEFGLLVELGLHLGEQILMPRVGHEVFGLVGVVREVEQFSPLFAAGVFDELGGVGAHREEGGRARVLVFQEILGQEGLAPVRTLLR